MNIGVEGGRELPSGSFGENFAVDALVEDSAHIGDRFAVGSAEAVVTEPRLPCYKLGVRFDSDEMVKRFLAKFPCRFPRGSRMAATYLFKQVLCSRAMTVLVGSASFCAQESEIVPRDGRPAGGRESKRPTMWGREGKRVRLYEELDTLDVF
ncbi:MAG TPA: MOSC domain-containing protein, partial [Candidatus Sulfotelmatobacter sp.]